MSQHLKERLPGFRDGCEKIAQHVSWEIVKFLNYTTELLKFTDKLISFFFFSNSTLKVGIKELETYNVAKFEGRRSE